MEGTRLDYSIKDCTVCGASKEVMVAIWNCYICESCEQEVENCNVLEN